ncbi:MAG: V-type ATP synthase subunit I, partial [Alistipes sp.]|nr:V-type ATP synthase subunit I [Alistipes sp.]
MIVRMMKYDIVLFAAERDRFIESLRETGMVDITTSGWEPTESDRALLLDIEARTKALAAIDSLSEDATTTKSVEAERAFECYTEAQSAIAAAKGDIARLEKSLEEWTPWGDFDMEQLAELAKAGVTLRYFVTSTSTYDKGIGEWGANYNIALINSADSQARFVVIGDGSEQIDVDAQELKAPTMNLSQLTAAVKSAEQRIADAEQTIVACAAHRSVIAAELAELKSQLQNLRISSTAEQAADGLLLVLEGWAEEANASKVDALLNASPSTVYIKSNPTPEDNTPVKLKNNCYARIFELVGNMYALPKYGTVDLTPFFAPFYMLFFAICLCDAGYGAVILAAGIALLAKGGKSLRQAALFSTVCGVASVAFGFAANSFFGMTISDAPLFEDMKFLDFQNQFFYASLGIGIFQILFGMAINIVMTTKTYGFKNALGSLGWFLLIFSSCAAGVAGMVGAEWYSFSSVAYMAT